MSSTGLIFRYYKKVQSFQLIILWEVIKSKNWIRSFTLFVSLSVHWYIHSQVTGSSGMHQTRKFSVGVFTKYIPIKVVDWRIKKQWQHTINHSNSSMHFNYQRFQNKQIRSKEREDSHGLNECFNTNMDIACCHKRSNPQSYINILWTFRYQELQSV